MRKLPLKALKLATWSMLSENSLAAAIDMAKDHPHDGWADVVVHQSQIRTAMQLAGKNNADFPVLHVRVLTDTTLAHEDWRLRTRSVEIRP